MNIGCMKLNCLLKYVVQHFYDSHSGFFWYSENDDKQVFARKIEIYDGVIPSGNSAMAACFKYPWDFPSQC